MKIGVLAQPSSWYVQDLTRAAPQGVSITSLEFERIRCQIEEGRHQVSVDQTNFESFDAVLVRTMSGGSLEQVVFRMDAITAAEHFGVRVINAPKAIETCVDKYLTSFRLMKAGLPVPDCYVCQDRDSALEAFGRCGGDAILKPIFGAEGRGMIRLNDADIAERVFRALSRYEEAFYLQPFIAHEGFDIRVLLIGDDCLGMKRINPHDWRTNISRGADAVVHQPTETEIELARSASNAVGTEMCGVDILYDQSGKPYLLEVNAVPGWKRIAQITGVDIAERVIRYCQEAS